MKRMFSQRQKDQIFQLSRLGWTGSEIAQFFGVKKSTVTHYIALSKRKRVVHRA